jgi:hypothetical protein
MFIIRVNDSRNKRALVISRKYGTRCLKARQGEAGSAGVVGVVNYLGLARSGPEDLFAALRQIFC